MPLDFDEAPPRTLGRKRTTKELEHETERVRIRNALRVIGGTMKAMSDVSRPKVEYLKNEYARKDALESVSRDLDDELDEYEDNRREDRSNFVSTPPDHKVAEWREYYAKGGTGVTPGWLPQTYKPFTRSRARIIARYMKGVPEFPIEPLHTKPTVVHSKRSKRGGVNEEIILVKDQSLIWKVTYSDEKVKALSVDGLTNLIWRDVNYGIVAVGMSRKKIERNLRQSKKGVRGNRWPSNVF